MMTKKHFVDLADALRSSQPDKLFASEDMMNVWDICVDHVASFCADQNPAFNRLRWLDYVNGRGDKNGKET